MAQEVAPTDESALAYLVGGNAAVASIRAELARARERGIPVLKRAEALGAHLAERLARYKIPKAWRFVDELPRNAMGKVQKNVLRERFGS